MTPVLAKRRAPTGRSSGSTASTRATCTATRSSSCATRPTPRTSRRRPSSTPIAPWKASAPPPQNWLIAIAHNVCRQRFRQSQRRPTEVVYEDELAETVVEEDALSAEDIRRALGHLAFNQRSALVMRELEGRSYQEIAEILEMASAPSRR